MLVFATKKAARFCTNQKFSQGVPHENHHRKYQHHLDGTVLDEYKVRRFSKN